MKYYHIVQLEKKGNEQHKTSLAMNNNLSTCNNSCPIPQACLMRFLTSVLTSSSDLAGRELSVSIPVSLTVSTPSR